MAERLRAVIVGAGWAGEGHARALRHHGVEVVAICARQAEVVGAVAARLGVAEGSTDWAEALRRHRPDLVTVATPASLREEVVAAACALGSHVLCEKPLAVDAGQAERLLRLVERAGVKHSYGVTHRYDPSVAWLAELVRGGAVGRLREIVVTDRVPLPPLQPWSWIMTLATGGGLLNNLGVHELAVLERIAGGPPIRAMGEARVLLDRAPVVPDLHDFRLVLAAARDLTPEQVQGLEWRACDADWVYSALLRFAAPGGEVQATLVSGLGTHAPGDVSRMRLYGDEGMLVADGGRPYAVARAPAGGGEPEPLPVPQRLLDELPRVAETQQDRWGALLRDFLADVRGAPHEPYPTFREGWRYQSAVDAIRTGRGWTDVPRIRTPNQVPS
jgi:predicted dehydrogenase